MEFHILHVLNTPQGKLGLGTAKDGRFYLVMNNEWDGPYQKAFQAVEEARTSVTGNSEINALAQRGFEIPEDPKEWV